MNKIESFMPGTIDFLIRKAKQKELTTYKEIANAVGTHPRVVPKILWKIESLRSKNNWPPLTAIVTRVDSHKPGAGFLKYLFPDIPEHEREVNWKRSTQKVYDFDLAPPFNSKATYNVLFDEKNGTHKAVRGEAYMALFGGYRGTKQRNHGCLQFVISL
ncbi:MAG: hypothetical protein Q7J85_12405 [Bacillota bacterium]|nr:hypothetical protein [Bacillota bacterium]